MFLNCSIKRILSSGEVFSHLLCIDLVFVCKVFESTPPSPSFLSLVDNSLCTEFELLLLVFLFLPLVLRKLIGGNSYNSHFFISIEFDLI